MTTPARFNEIWDKGNYRLGSTALRLVPFLKRFIPSGVRINDYGSGTGRAEIELLKAGYRVNMVDFADNALEGPVKALIDGDRLTYRVAPLEALPADFPVEEWGICINVLMLVDPGRLDAIMKNMRNTCRNLIIEVYDWPDVRLGTDLTLIKGDAEWWTRECLKYWPVVESHPSPENRRRYIMVCREASC